MCEEENITNCSINLKIMDDMEMQKLNKDFRSINKPTNVLSFANEDISKEHTGNLGDIAIKAIMLLENLMNKINNMMII